jgi:NlpC/P60 family
MSDSAMSDSLTSTPIFTARQVVRAGCCALAFCIAAVGASAQQSTERRDAAPAVRLVSAAQGRKIAAAALEPEGLLRDAQDCSHLVHQVYSLAGYEYPYVSSFDLYAGNGNFRRVRHAQAGDLITWPGHVGIVLDPKQHSFYSLVRSGLQSEDYLGPYWRSRGRPRFYRYVVDAGSDVETAKVERPAARSGQSAIRGSITAKTEVRSEAENANEKQTTEEAALRSPVPAAKAPANAIETESVSSSVLITPEQRRPTTVEAYDKILERSSAAAGALLHTAEPLQVKTAIVVLDELRVERVETKRDKGWLHLQIDSHVRIAGDGVDFKRRREKIRWELRRDASGWAAIPPGEPAYVTRDVAVRELAAQLAEMTQSEAAANHDESVIGQEARIANLLSALLQK